MSTSHVCIVQEQYHVTVAYQRDMAQIKVFSSLQQGYADALHIFSSIAAAGINVDLVNIYPGRIKFVVSSTDLNVGTDLLQTHEYTYRVVPNCAKLWIESRGGAELRQTAADIVEILAQQQVTILQLVNSSSALSVLIQQEKLETAVNALRGTLGKQRC